MSTETVLVVRVPGSDANAQALLRDLRSATARALKAVPGERIDIVRVESLSSQLERLAATYAASSVAESSQVRRINGDQPVFIDRDNLHLAPSDWRSTIGPWVTAGDIAVELHNPFSSGGTKKPEHGRVPESEQAWRSPIADVSPKRAAALRFTEQVKGTLTRSDPPAFVEPSGVSNAILTETLRQYVTMSGERVDAPVRYQDGSLGRPFPLRSLSLADTVPSMGRELRLAMLSIRHTEMDVEVDGCWFRNFNISRPRPAGETDQLAFETSQKQLESVLASGPLLIRLYQTGLETAVVGLYRAVVHQLLTAPGSVAVVPMYFRHPPRLPDGAVPDPAVPMQASYFAEGKPWATR